MTLWAMARHLDSISQAELMILLWNSLNNIRKKRDHLYPEEQVAPVSNEKGTRDEMSLLGHLFF